MKLTILSGLSGAGKTIALHALEDENYYCIDNLPLKLLPTVARTLIQAEPRIAVGVDARSGGAELDHFDQVLSELRELGVEVELIFLQAQEETLLQRYSETRRKHPLSNKSTPLTEAIRKEKKLLSRIAELADLTIDTTHLNVHQLSRQIRDRLHPQDSSTGRLSVLVQSFGFKHGLPLDSDFVFDVRCLPNPHWEPRLRRMTGQEEDVVQFLEKHDSVETMYQMIRDFVAFWIPRFSEENRRYLSISIGCTGGQHRSVYLVDRLGKHLNEHFEENVSVRHRELP
jgi:UPF0042 nucleotide-binding protein